MKLTLSDRRSQKSLLVEAAPPQCLCGHDQELHEHLRRGSDCGSCGRDICRSYRRRPHNVAVLRQALSFPLAKAG